MVPPAHECPAARVSTDGCMGRYMSRTAEETFLYLQRQLDYMTASKPYSRSELISGNVREYRYKPPSAGTSAIPSSCHLCRSHLSVLWYHDLKRLQVLAKALTRCESKCLLYLHKILPAGDQMLLGEKQHYIFFSKIRRNVCPLIIVTGERSAWAADSLYPAEPSLWLL